EIWRWADSQTRRRRRERQIDDQLSRLRPQEDDRKIRGVGESLKMWEKYMSTVVVVKKNGRACIAADTLVSWGSTKQSAEYLADKSKIIQVGDSYIGITGSSTHRHVIESYFSHSESFSLDSVPDIFETWREFHKALKSDYFLTPGEDKEAPYESSHM